MIKFKCESDNDTFELSDKELKNIRPVIDRFGKARLLINYFDFEYCVNSTTFCNKINIIEEEVENVR